MNSLGLRLADEGDVEGALGQFDPAIDAGSLDALSSFSWVCFAAGQSQRACDRMNAVIGVTTRDGIVVPDEVVANVMSNDALNRLAVGGEVDEALNTWYACAGTGHAESRFYPAVLHTRSGTRSQRKSP
jgi:hypothetical protein